MKKLCRLIIVAGALIAFGMASMAVAADFYVVKDAKGKMSVVDTKPADAKSIVKGPFTTKADAEKAMKAEATPAKAEKPAKKPVMPPAEGC